MSVIVGSFSSGSMGPRPRSSSNTSLTSALRSALFSAWFCLASKLVDDVADFSLNLLAGHLLQRLKIDQVEQLLVEGHLQVGVGVPVRERSCVANRDDPQVFRGSPCVERPCQRFSFVPATSSTLPSEGTCNARV